MLNAGDLHNFGRRVHLTSDPTGKPAFFKPRTIFWERQFLSEKSHLRESLRSRLGFDPLEPLGTTLFHSENDDRSGFMAPVSRDETSDPKLLRSFARVSAIAAAFGIVDLHGSNCIPTLQSRFALVDIECPFFDCESLGETALIGRRGLPAERSGWAHLKAALLKAGPAAAAYLIFEHYRYLGVIEDCSDAIIESLGALALRSTPIRVILRATKDYSNLQGLIEPLVEEETTQLERGDMPYFFKFLGDPTLYNYISETEFRPVQERAGTLWDPVRRSATAVEKLFSKKRLRRIRLQSTLLLSKRLCEATRLEHFKNGEFSLTRAQGELVLEVGNLTLKGRIAV